MAAHMDCTAWAVAVIMAAIMAVIMAVITAVMVQWGPAAHMAQWAVCRAAQDIWSMWVIRQVAVPACWLDP